MQEIIKFQTRQRVKKILDKKQDKTNLQKLKKSRYMRQDYKQNKKRLTVSMDLVDFENIQKHAKKSGITPTTFLRACSLAYLKDERVPSKQAEKNISELVFLLRNLGNNINQIARQSNTIQKVALGDFLSLKTLLSHLEDTAEHAIKKLL